MDARPMPLPCAVGLQVSAGLTVHPAILLEWIRKPDTRGRMAWWALVAYASESSSHPAIQFRMTVEVVPPDYLVGLPDGLRWSGRT